MGENGQYHDANWVRITVTSDDPTHGAYLSPTPSSAFTNSLPFRVRVGERPQIALLEVAYTLKNNDPGGVFFVNSNICANQLVGSQVSNAVRMIQLPGDTGGTNQSAIWSASLLQWVDASADNGFVQLIQVVISDATNPGGTPRLTGDTYVTFALRDAASPDSS